MVCLTNNRPIACMMLTYEWSDWRDSTVVWIQSLFVVKDRENSGVFKNMYKALVDRVNNSDEFSGIRLYVDQTNQTTINVYTRNGYDR